MELLDYVRVVRKRLWVMMLIVFVACVGTGLYTQFMMTPVYQASSKLIVNQYSREDGVDQLNFNDVNTNIRLVTTYKEIAESSAIMDEVVRRKPEIGLTSEQLVDRISVTSRNDTQVLTISIDDASYERAADIVNTVSLVFQEQIPSIMNVDNVKILSKAKPAVDPSPISPSLTLNLLVSLIVSAALALTLIFLLDYLDDTIKSEKDIAEHLHAPTFAVITKIHRGDWHEKNSVASKLEDVRRHAAVSE